MALETDHLLWGAYEYINKREIDDFAYGDKKDCY